MTEKLDKKRHQLMKIIAEFMADNVPKESLFMVIVVTPTTDDGHFDKVSNVSNDAQRVILEKAMQHIDDNSGTSEIYNIDKPIIN